jgi:Tol biopolymer transport system component
MARIAGVVLFLAVAMTHAATADVVVVTRSASGNATALGDDTYSIPSLSWNGRFVAYASNATDIVAGHVDSNGKFDVFLFDRETNTNILVSRSASDRNTAGSGESTAPQISADGNFVVFASSSRDLVPGMGGAGGYHLYLYDRRADSVKLITHVEESATTAGDGASELGFPAISADGRYTVYASRATNLVTGLQKSGGHHDVFLYDRMSDQSRLLSHIPGSAVTAGSAVAGNAAINLNGTKVAFSSWAPSVVAGITDTNNVDDIFLYDIATGVRTLVSHAADSATKTSNKRSFGASMDISGTKIVFESTASDLVPGQVDRNNDTDVFLFDLDTGMNTLVTHIPTSATTTGTRPAHRPMISTDGNIVVFNSSSTDLYGRSGNDLHVYRYDRRTNALDLVTYAVGSTVPADESAATFSMSGDGRRIAINSAASNLVAGQADTNGLGDAFVWDADMGAVFLASSVPGSTTRTGNGHTLSTYISGDGSVGIFTSYATNLAATDANDAEDIFLWHKPRVPQKRRALR